MDRELKEMDRAFRAMVLETVCTYDRIAQKATKDSVVDGIMALKSRVDSLAAKAEESLRKEKQK